MTRSTRLFCLFFGLLLATRAHICWAQFSGSVQGNVLAAGAAVPNARVTLVNDATQVKNAATSDSTGVYRFVSLAPGEYTVSATASGFNTTSVHFALNTSENRDVPLNLSVAQVSTTVEVSTQAPVLDTSDTRLQYTLSTEALDTLPLSTRNPTGLIGVTPGVTGALDAQNNNINNPENFIDASANGRGENGNLYVVDGLDVTSNIRPGVVNLTPSADSVQEVTVQTNTYSVDYGRGSGIQTQMTTKSGTERFHGFASELYTYQKLNARGEFGPSPASVPNLPANHTNNAAFGVGGPVIPHHKFFFFGTYEPYNNEGNAYSPVYYEDPAFTAFAQQVMPNSPELKLLTQYPVGSTTGVTVYQTAAQLFGQQNTSANSGCGTPSTDNIPCTTSVIDVGQFNFGSYNKAKQYGARVDKYFNKDRVYVDFIRNTRTVFNPTARPDFNNTDNYYGFAMQGSETHTFRSDLLNEGVFALNRIEGIQPQSGDFTVPVVSVGGLQQGFGDGFAQGDYIQHSYHWRDVLTYVRGSHDFRLGYEGWHGDDTAIFAGPYGQPNFYFFSLIDLINNNPYNETSLSYNPVSGASQPGNYGYSVTTGGGFAADTWKVKRNITLDYGIRYDNWGNPAPSLTGTIAAPFYRGTGATLAQQVANGYIKAGGHSLAHDINWIFSPRAGVSWDLRSNSKTLVKGGFGVYHDQVTLGNIADLMKSNPPNWVLPTFFNNGSTATPVFGFGTSNSYPFGFTYPAFQGTPLNAQGGITGSQVTIGSVDVNISAPTTLNWSGSVEQALGSHMAAFVSYVGSHSSGIQMGGGQQGGNQFGYDLNDFPGDLIQHASCSSATACSGYQTRLNKSFGQILYAYNVARANYSALIADIRGRFPHGLFFTASYTRSVSRDDETYYTPSGDFNQDRFYGNSPYDYPNRFSAAGSYRIPDLHLGNGFVNRISSGYGLSGTVTLQSGPPIFVETSAAFSASLINPALPPSATNLKYNANSGDFNADGYNYDLPNVDRSYHIATSRAAYKSGVFPICPGAQFDGCGPFTFPTFGQQGNEAVSDQWRNPGFAQVDTTLSKTTRIAEGINLDLRIEAFNLFNRVNFYGIDANALDSTFGLVPQSTGNYHTPRYLQLGASINF